MSKFSIILPVRNGGRYVKECVNSILSQSLDDFNLIVLDNCSSDGTLEWIKSLNDYRIICYPSEKPLTIEENWARIVSIPKNEFITLIGHDDVLEPRYLETMTKLIDRFPNASLYQTHFNFIDSVGKVIRPARGMKEIERADEFLSKILTKEIDIIGTGFIMRSRDYDNLGGIPDYPGLLFADYELWLNLTKLEYKATSPDVCFAFRKHQSATTTSSDKKMQDAFQRFVKYLHSLQLENEELNKVILIHGERFLLNECKALCHRLLRTPRSLSNHEVSVKHTILCFQEYANTLLKEQPFEPLKEPTIKLANIIDKSEIGRKLFLLFKKMYPKPVLK